MAEYSRPQTLEQYDENFDSIKPLMNPTMAYYESSRCLFCFDAPCVQACPTEIDIPLFIRQINTGNVAGAAQTIYDSNYFGNACGKVCPTEVLCEGACVYNHQEVKPIEIGRLQSFATTQAITNQQAISKLEKENGHKVAIIGAGPAGISCACELRSLGYHVDIYEAKSQPSGLTLYGCAPYKIHNKEVLEEMAYLQSQFGFTIHYNKPVQTAEQFKTLEADYDAIFLGIGLGNTRALNIPGEGLPHCIGATEYIEQIKIDPLNTVVGKTVVVIGGGNTAMDAASESARMGAEQVYLVYRRPKESMGAYEFEYELAKAVGVKGLFNLSPVSILGKEKVEGLRLIKTEVVEGRVKSIEGSETVIACDMLILATGQEKQKSLLNLIDNMDLDAKGRLKVDNNFQTSHPHYFAAGDAVNGGAEVVNACGEAKAAAKAIHQYILSK